MTKCPSCSQKLSTRFEYCPKCGEELNRHKFTFKHIITEFVEGFSHLDFKIITYIKLLFIKPWFIAYEYLHGRKKKYFNPYVAFVLFAGMLVFQLHSSNSTYTKKIEMNLEKQRSKFSSGEYQENVLKISKYREKQAKLISINKYFHLLNLFIYALPFWLLILLFFNKSYNYIETVFVFMILWTFAFVIYSLTGFLSDGLFFYYDWAIPDKLISVIVSVFIGYNFYKFLDIEKKFEWMFIFSGLFFVLDNTIIPFVIKTISLRILLLDMH